MQNRRKFLISTLVAATGTGLASRIFSQSLPVQENNVKEKKFVYRTLGNTGIKIPIVSMGTGNTDNPNLIREALDRGVKLFAT